MKILIAGGGIGGLVTAMRLHQAGFEVKVFESVEAVKPLGVGINILPHAVRVLTNIGLLDKVAAIAVETKDLAIHDPGVEHIVALLKAANSCHTRMIY